MVNEWFGVEPDALVVVIANAVGIYVAVMLYTRLVGLRSYAKMSSFDFAMTVAIGSTIASTVVSSSVSLLSGIVGVGMIFLLQLLVATARVVWPWTQKVDNDPLLLMAGPHVIDEHLHRGRVSLGELRSKLREANVIAPEQIRAVVLETTGDVTVLHTSDDTPLDLGLLDGVVGAELLADLESFPVTDASRSLWRGPAR